MAEQFDLNLLRVFDALLQTRSVTGAATRLHLSVPATSRALGRLRLALNDQILVRAGRGLVPTPFALRRAQQVKALLESITRLRDTLLDSEPASWERTFVIRINDGLAPVISPRLTHRIAAEAPGVQVRFVAQTSKDTQALRDGSLDLDIGVADPPPPDVQTQTLFTDHFVAIVAAHSQLGRASELSVEDLCNYPHISASRKGLDHGPLDDELYRLGRSRRVIAVVPTYAVATLLALEDDVICLVPRVLAQHLIERHVPLRWHEVPLPLPSAKVELRWHQRLDEDLPSQWLRNHVRASIKPLIVQLSS